MDSDPQPKNTHPLPVGEATRRAAEARRRLAELEPGEDATTLIQEIGDEQGYVELPRGVYTVGATLVVDEYRLSTRPRIVGGGP